MKRTLLTGTTLVLLGLLVFPCALRAGDFNASVHLVLSTSDGRAQLRFHAEADEGLRMLHVRDPQGKLVTKVVSRDDGKLGQALLLWETTEPSLEAAFHAYPPGEYRFTGWLRDGRILEHVSVLSAELPAPPVVTFPADGQSGLPLSDWTVTWQASADSGGYGVEVDAEDTEESLTAELPSRTLSFSFPGSWLTPAREYTIDVTARGRNGNAIVSSVTFTTAP